MEDTHAIAFRLPRRDHEKAPHSHALPLIADTEMTVTAAQLRRARRHLRDLVDEIDLLATGVAA
ncbi:hypothetical protein [Stenotrophomonas sp. PS02289]|uniref:hypothetical protein n=1 Tax=Stenotrophomonas sp. PS02289 TaxID=2991422 RepID=UPI00249C2E3F|nr:hypothetical protein [Stenotrophomonas sp. PS02289]